MIRSTVTVLLPLLFIMLIGGMVIWIQMRHSYRALHALPAHPAPPRRTARLGETFVVALLAGAAIIFIGFGLGPLHRLADLPEKLATLHLMSVAVATIIAITGVALCWRRGATLGAILGAIAVLLYGFTIEQAFSIHHGLLPQGFIKPIHRYTITIQNEIEGAEVIVNGVSLGKTPVHTTLEAFEKMVPYWPDKPEDYETARIEIPRYRLGGGGKSTPRRWADLTLPERMPNFGRRERVKKTYYARVILDGEEGGYRGSGGSGTGVSSYNYHYETTLRMVFPKRIERLESLLDQARSRDYDIDRAWIEAIEAFGREGWRTLREAAQREQDMQQVIDQWVRLRYNLDHTSAHSLLDRICAEADGIGRYATDSPAGRAVELIAPQLDALQLADQAVRVIERHANASYSVTWHREGERLDFEGRAQERNRYRPPHLYAVAHACWIMDQHLDRTAPAVPNVIETRVMTVLLQQDVASPSYAAATIGGPVVDRFLLRQNWRANVDIRSHHRNRTHIGGEYVNTWLMHLIYLNDAAGSHWRSRNQHNIFQVADKVLEHHVSIHRINFLFHDKQLANGYWQRFVQRTKREHDPLNPLIEYLLRLEPASTVDQYVQVLETHFDHFYGLAIDRLDKMPTPKRIQILQALRQRVELRPAAFAAKVDLDITSFEGDFNWNIEEALIKAGQPEALRRLIEILREQPRNHRYTRDRIRNWLTHTAPDHPLINLLAEDNDPDLRALVLPALKAHPTPHNRALLAKLNANE